MKNFAVGPVVSEEYLLKISGEQVPYFRTPEFSKIILESECLIKELADAPNTAKAIFVTGSGTAAMEATVMNVFSSHDKVLVVNGGSFGERFCELCRIHHVAYDELIVPFGENISDDLFKKYIGCGYTGLLINVCETSTGVLYDMKVVKKFCQNEGILLIADAISAFMSDPLSMKELGIDVIITGSQKALACQPGVSIIVLSERAQNRVFANNPNTLYFNLKLAIKNSERGQTPFTPAVGIIRQIHEKLVNVQRIGIARWIEKTKIQANDFRERIATLPFVITSKSLSNTVTPLHPLMGTTSEIVMRLKDEYGIWVCPNGGVLGRKIFRVGHIGDLTLDDNKILVDALKNILVV